MLPRAFLGLLMKGAYLVYRVGGSDIIGYWNRACSLAHAQEILGMTS